MRGRLGSFENLLGLMVEIVLLEDLDDEGNERFWKVSIGNCKLNSTGYLILKDLWVVREG